MKLKQQLALSLCAIYLVSIIGIALSMHFCGGKLASVSISSAQSACKICKTEAADKKDDGCCKNTKVDVKVKDSHQTAASFKLAKLFSFDVLFPVSAHAIFKKTILFLSNSIENKAPPKSAGVAIHVLNCVFRN